MPERWLPTDPRAEGIHRLLLLVGGEPAPLALAACRLMDGDYRLEATTRVVGHLLRELDLALRAVLRPLVAEGAGGGYRVRASDIARDHVRAVQPVTPPGAPCRAGRTRTVRAAR